MCIRDRYTCKCGPFLIRFFTHCRQVKEIFFDLHTRRLGGWDGKKKVEPPAPRSVQTTPTPQIPLPPPASASDYSSVKAVLQPVPISAATPPQPGAGVRNVYQTASGGGGGCGEVQVDYASVNLVSPQPSSAFIPPSAHHQQLQKTHSLPIQPHGIRMRCVHCH